jgi:hypothetical protein
MMMMNFAVCGEPGVTHTTIPLRFLVSQPLYPSGGERPPDRRGIGSMSKMGMCDLKAMVHVSQLLGQFL